ncbi:hypothetical protein BGX23_010363 [Mortierella sp. AD031]|nr:hypothetical protein BGX23_010363 [Mortierella sp. AD031]
MLTMEQFKWSMICCCNEIKTRVFKHQQQQRQGSPDETPHAPSSGQKSSPDSYPYPYPAPTPTSAISSPSTNKKSDKNKSRSSNGTSNNNNNNAGSGNGHLHSSTNNNNNNTNNSTRVAAIDAATQDSRATLQALLLVMTSSSMSEKDREGALSDPTPSSSVIVPVQGFRGSGAAGPHAQSQSLLSLVGPGSGGGIAMSATGAAPPMRSHSIHHLSRYPSHSSLTAGVPPSQQQQATSAGAAIPLRNNKAQSGTTNTYAQATNAILNPLSLQELALLLAYTLSIAPEQWVPWHLYDFFVRPQGRSYKDLSEMLPTHSQRILKALLETVEALINYATAVGLQQQRAQLHQQQLQSGPTGKQPTLAHLRSKSDVVDPGYSRNNGVYGVGVGGSSPMLRSGGSSTLSLARALAILEPPFSAAEQYHLQQLQQLAGARGGDTVHQEIALRGRKRRVILDSLSGLVFRSRQSEGHHGGAGGAGSGSMGVFVESSSEGGLQPPEEKGAGSKGKAMRRRSFLGATSTSNGASTVGSPSPAAVALQLQMSEREREAGHLAFENLVSAFEAEFVRPLSSSLAVGPGTDAKAGTATGKAAEVVYDSQDELPNVTLPPSLAAAGSVARDRSFVGNIRAFGQGIDRSATLPLTSQLPPRQARSLPTAISSPVGTDLAAVRSLSLPPWRKKHHSALQLGQQLPPSPGASTATLTRQDWLPQYQFQSQYPCQQPITNRVLTGASVSSKSNSIVESPAEELQKTLSPPASVSASGSNVALPALVTPPVAITGAPVVTMRPSGSAPAVGSSTAGRESAVDAESPPPVVTTVPRSLGAVEGSSTTLIPSTPAPTPAAAITAAAAPTTLSRSSSKRSSTSTRKDRPTSMDEDVENKVLRTRTLSGTLSSTWTTWKDHLLILEEEEYLIEDSSESLSSSSSLYYSDSGSENDEGGGEGGDDNDRHDRPKDTDRVEEGVERRRRRKEGKGDVEGEERRKKSSGTFGDLEQLAAAIAASQAAAVVPASRGEASS